MKKTNFKLLQDRTWLLSIVIFLLLVFALSRFFYLQIIEGRNLKVQREANINTFEYIYPKRGRIISSDGYVLAEDIKSYSIAVDLEEKPSVSSIDLLVKIYPERLTRSSVEESIKLSIKGVSQEVLIDGLNQAGISKFLVRNGELAGFSVIEKYNRSYVDHPSMFHVLGHLGYVNNSDINFFRTRIDNFKPNIWQLVGKSGIERVYEAKLQGVHGKKFFNRNARGNRKVLIDEESFKEGEEVVLSINYEAQSKAFDLLGNRKGSIVVLDLKNFSIPVSVSTPSISANDLKGISTVGYKALLDDSSRPLFNRAFMGLYPPGSTIKPILTIFAISNNLTNWTETIDDDGFFRFEEENRVFNAWKEGGHGITNLRKAIVESSNPFFMNLATRYDKDKLTAFFTDIFFDKTICIDCYPQLFSPLIDDVWKQKNFGSNIFKGDIINIGIGQGYLLTSPLHLALMAGIIAKKGEYNIPFLIQQNEPLEETKKINTNISDDDWSRIHEAMIGVVYSKNGTGYRINPGELKLAGKSGTSQLKKFTSREEYEEIRENPDLRDHAIFIGFAPYDDPRYAISVLVENGESGGAVAGPIAKEVLLELINAD